VPGALDLGARVGWLQKRAAFKDAKPARAITSAMQDTPDRLAEIARHFFRTVRSDDQRWYAFINFVEAILFEIGTDAMLDLLMDELGATAAGSERQLLLFEFANSRFAFMARNRMPTKCLPSLVTCRCRTPA